MLLNYSLQQENIARVWYKTPTSISLLSECTGECQGKFQAESMSSVLMQGNRNMLAITEQSLKTLKLKRIEISVSNNAVEKKTDLKRFD